MDRAPSAELDPALFEANLTALREIHPALAERVAEQPVAPAEAVTARDGSVTFRVPGPEGQSEWFGRTSMPTVSGPALLESFDRGTGSVALPGIGQGIEVRLLCESLAPHRAVFVLEPDPKRLALALRLHALHGAIRCGKLVLISSDDLAATLTEFLTTNAGYLFPERMLSRPWMSQAELHEYTATIERAGSTAIDHRTKRLAEIEKTLSTLQREDGAAHIVGLALHPSVRTALRAGDIARDATDAGVAWRHCIMDSPANGHLLAHLRLVANHRPELVVLLDHTRGDLPASFPDALPVVSWFDTPAVVTDNIADRIGPADRLCPTSAHLAGPLVNAGVAQEQIHIVPHAVAQSDLIDEETVDADPEPYRCDVAIFADGADLNPAVWGLVLASHEAFYNTLSELLHGEADRFYAHETQQYLQRVERMLGLKLDEGEVRTVMCRQIEQVIGPTTCTLAVVRELIAAGLAVRLYGNGWEKHDAVRKVRRSPPEDAAAERSALAGCRLVIHADPSGHARREVFLAAAARRPVLYRKHPFDNEPGGMATLFEDGVETLAYRNAKEAAALAQRLLTDPAASNRLAAAAQERVRNDHTLSHRLRTLRDIAIIRSGEAHS